MANPVSLDGTSISPEVRIFFREIKEHPDDDTPRLIFADWLQEHGNPANAVRGEFLRLQVLRQRLSPDDPNHDLLKRQESELVKQHGWTWLGPVPDAALWRFERGMMQIAARADKILTTEISDWARTEAGLWIDSLTLRDMPAAHFDQLARSPLLAHLTRLDLSDNSLESSLRPLFREDSLPYLSEFVLSRNQLRIGHIVCLVARRHSRRLAILDLRHNQLGDLAAPILAASSHLKNLVALRVGHNRFTADGIAVLRQAFGERVHF